MDLWLASIFALGLTANFSRVVFTLKLVVPKLCSFWRRNQFVQPHRDPSSSWLGYRMFTPHYDVFYHMESVTNINDMLTHCVLVKRDCLEPFVSLPHDIKNKQVFRITIIVPLNCQLMLHKILNCGFSPSVNLFEPFSVWRPWVFWLVAAEKDLERCMQDCGGKRTRQGSRSSTCDVQRSSNCRHHTSSAKSLHKWKDHDGEHIED